MTHPFSYEGLRVVVTGGARGVGAALLDVLAELDAAHVTVIDLNPPSGPHDAFLATVAQVAELGMVESQQVEDRRVEVVNVDPVDRCAKAVVRDCLNVRERGVRQ